MTVTENQPIQAFVEAWNVDDLDERRRLIQQSWASDGVLMDPPDTIFHGQDELVRAIDEYMREWEGGKVRISEVNTNAVAGHFLLCLDCLSARWLDLRPGYTRG
ncbi:MAG: hypothetical protein NVS2B16_01730 [Chloroflexota bacterium]